ncbi:hypothetical protein [Endothiovibrio diazotrophicus]
MIHLQGEAEEYEEWVEGRGWMASLAAARNELLRGDLRLLYLAWLFCAEGGEVDDSAIEPPVPAGLGSLPASLQTVVEFLRIDPHLIAAAAERSPAETPDPGGLAAWVAALPAKEKDDLLYRVVQGEEASVAAALVRRHRAEARRPTDVQGGRRVAELLERADELRDAYVREQARRAEESRRRREAAEAAARAGHLDKLATRKAQAWKEMEPLVSSKKSKAYDQAVALLVDLRDLAVREGDEQDFVGRLAALRERHARKPSFIARLDRAGLPKGGV